MKVVLLSTGQPATNPRLLKAADALAGAGYTVKAYCSYCTDWAFEMDRRLMETRSWSLEYIGGLPNQTKWFWSRLRFALARKFLNATGHYIFGLKEWALSRTTSELITAARRDKADCYIGHNLGALPAIVAGARKNGGRVLFDLEDSYTDMCGDEAHKSPFQTLMHRIEDAYIPACDELIAASDGIGAIYCQRYCVSPVTILNVFPLEWGIEAVAHKKRSSLRLFWFSQTIGPDRGLQDVLSAMAQMRQTAIELHLLGSWQPGYRERFFADARSLDIDVERQIRSYPPCSPEEIPRFAALFDVGLALEVASSKNRDVCLSNKIFTYLLAGNVIIATETRGQKSFFDNLPQVGFTYPPGDIDALVNKLEVLASDRQLLARLSKQAIAQARSRYNWDIEGRKLLNLISRTSIVSESHTDNRSTKG